jgi:superfamily II DNA or RNA helicase
MKNEFYPLEFKDSRKEKIQKEAYKKWEESNYKGIIVAPTGIGKSFLIYMALLKHRHLGKLFVIVPKIDLLHQTYNDIIEKCQVKPEFVGRIGGGFKEDSRPITIAVIDSIRDKVFSSELLIIDEMHRVLSSKNRKFLVKGNHKRIMGLTATIGPQDLLPVIYTMKQEEAVNKGLISKFKIVNIGCDLLPMEQRKYNWHDTIVKKDMRHFGYDMATIINVMKCSNDYEMKTIATGIFRAIQGRKSIVCNSQNKLDTTIKLIKDNINNKILVFCEYIKTADYIIKTLKKDKIKAGKFHSKMKSVEKQNLFDKFKNNEVTIMIAVKGLDEGTNIPDCDMGIIVSGSSVERQIVQRIGRVVRVSPNKEYATIFQIYVRNSKDEDWTKTRTKFMKKSAMSVEWK